MSPKAIHIGSADDFHTVYMGNSETVSRPGKQRRRPNLGDQALPILSSCSGDAVDEAVVVDVT